MRRLLVLSTLCVARLALAQDADQAALDAARSAGYTSPSILARGGVVVVQDASPGSANPFVQEDEPTKRVGVFLASGPTWSEIAKLTRPAASATLKPFLGRKDLFDVDLTISPTLEYGGRTTHRRLIVRTLPLELACDLPGGSDTGSSLKDQRFITTVDVALVSKSPLVFKVTTKERGNRGAASIHVDTVKTYSMGDAGLCLEAGK